METKISTGTIVRTACLALTLTNQILSACGKPIIPIESEQLETLITTGLTVGVSLWTFWQNNSFTTNAIKADNYLDRLNENSKK